MQSTTRTEIKAASHFGPLELLFPSDVSRVPCGPSLEFRDSVGAGADAPSAGCSVVVVVVAITEVASRRTVEIVEEVGSVFSGELCRVVEDSVASASELLVSVSTDTKVVVITDEQLTNCVNLSNPLRHLQ